jgi:hypothetical protein
VLAKTCRKPLRLAISAASATSSLQKFSVHDVIQRGTCAVWIEGPGMEPLNSKARSSDKSVVTMTARPWWQRSASLRRCAPGTESSVRLQQASRVRSARSGHVETSRWTTWVQSATRVRCNVSRDDCATAGGGMSSSQ